MTGAVAMVISRCHSSHRGAFGRELRSSSAWACCRCADNPASFCHQNMADSRAQFLKPGSPSLVISHPFEFSSNNFRMPACHAGWRSPTQRHSQSRIETASALSPARSNNRL